jgi:hypothetical protein
MNQVACPVFLFFPSVYGGLRIAIKCAKQWFLGAATQCWMREKKEKALVLFFFSVIERA